MCDKIRVLWIDDRERGKSAFPEADLPVNLGEWFEIAHHQKDGHAWSYVSADDFSPVFNKFWNNKNRDVLPAEIVAMDYNLKKSSGLKIGGISREEALARLLASSQASTNRKVRPEKSLPSESRTVNFDGLLLGLFYATLVHEHPMGLVPMTLYADYMPSEVETLHKLTTPFLGVSYNNIGMPPSERRWDNLLKHGVEILRRRIKELYYSGSIVVSPSDIMNLVDDNTHDVLTIHSPFATRRLPVQGLFIDVLAENRNEKITNWAKELQKNIPFTSDDFKEANDLKLKIWAAYMDVDDQLINDRRKLSFLHNQKKSRVAIDDAEYNRLRIKFNVRGDKCELVLDITCNKKQSVRRLTVLLLIYELLKLSLKNKGKIKIESDDIYLALFPMPSDVVFPWDEGKDLSSSRFGKVLDFRIQEDGKKVSHRLSVNDVLDGNGAVPGVSFGLTVSERIFLRGLMLDDGITEDQLLENNSTRRVLYGGQ